MHDIISTPVYMVPCAAGPHCLQARMSLALKRSKANTSQLIVTIYHITQARLCYASGIR